MVDKKKRPYIITAVLVVFFIVLGLVACATSSGQRNDISYSGENSRVLENTAWTFIVNDTTLGISRYQIIDFLPNGKLQVSYTTTNTGFSSTQDITTRIDLRGNSSWERTGLDVKLIFENGNYHGEGKHYPESKYISGTLFSSDGKETKFSMEHIGVADTSSSFAGSFLGSTTNRFYTAESNFSTSGDNGQMIRAGNRFISFTSITGYRGNDTNLRIPPIINNLLVTSIGNAAFENKNLTNVTIPNAVNAGRNDNIKHQKVINRAEMLGDGTTPDIDGYAGISTIGDRAFANNNLTSITIGADIVISESAFDNMFVRFYENNRRRAGRYTFINGQWTVEFR